MIYVIHSIFQENRIVLQQLSAEITIASNTYHEVILFTPCSIHCSAIGCVSLMLGFVDLLMRSFRSISFFIFLIIAVMGGCLGCPKVPFMTSNDKKPTGGLNKDSVTNKASVIQDFWSSSTCEMDKDNSAGQSQLSASSVSMSNPNLDGRCSSGNPPEFVNHGLLLWNQTRQQWIANKGSSHRKKAREPAISWNATYDNLLGSNKPFPRSIPLPEMVNFLVDVWEEEGLYD